MLCSPSFCFLCSLTWHYSADSFACPKLYRLAFLIENRYNWIYWVIVLAQPYSFTSQLAIGMFQSPASAALTVHRKRLQGKLCRKVFHRFRPTLTSCRWKIIFNETLLHSNPGNCIGRLIMPSTHPMQPSKRDQTDLRNSWEKIPLQHPLGGCSDPWWKMPCFASGKLINIWI